jgi:hypothetical protein
MKLSTHGVNTGNTLQHVINYAVSLLSLLHTLIGAIACPILLSFDHSGEFRSFFYAYAYIYIYVYIYMYVYLNKRVQQNKTSICQLKATVCNSFVSLVDS